MGCNAWNHPINCNCGWGGDTGGGGRQGSSTPYRSMKVIDGFDWRRDRAPSYATYVNPNASCPVCGASVYFYKSPYGGRVFFDELGPPWPKHPCTDNYLASIKSKPDQQFVVGPKKLSAPPSTRLPKRHEWRPLIFDAFLPGREFDCLTLPQRERIPGKVLYIPAGWISDAPAFWRWCPENPVLIEVSCIRIPSSNEVETQLFSVPNWLNDDEEFDAWRLDPNSDLTPESLNAVGFALSFAWRLPNLKRWYDLPGVDLQLARSYFERAASGGFWAAVNNLAVMYLDGLGVTSNSSKAFKLFEQAAQSLETTPLRHLADCYRDGIGCDKDKDFCMYLEELIEVKLEEEDIPVA